MSDQAGALPGVDFSSVTPVDPVRVMEATEALSAGGLGAGEGASALGELAAWGGWLAACQDAPSPQPLERVHLAICAAERSGSVVSALDEGSVAALAGQYGSGRSPVQAAAATQGVGVDFLDATAHVPNSPSVEETQPGGSATQQALQAGVAYADQHADQGTQLLLLGDYGPGTTTTAAAIIGAICGIEPVKVVGWGSGIGDDQWRAKVDQIRDDMFAVRDFRSQPAEILERIGSPHIAMLTGILAQAAVRRTPVIFDGVGCAAAALCAQMLAPTARDWWQAATAGTEPATLPALKALSLTPMLSNSIGLGQGAANLLALPHLQLATRFTS